MSKAVCISSSLAFGNCDYANDIVDGYIEEIENNEMIRDFSGLLVGAWALKVGIDDALLDEDVTIYLEKAREYIILYPDNSLLVEKYFDLLSSAVTYQYKRKANKTEIDYCYSLALRFPAEKGVLREFFELLGKSSERSRWSYYLENKSIRTGLVKHRLIKYLLEPLRTSTDAIVRGHKKVRANEPCPCGSGKKFKRCCKGKGYYD